jgi:hypothetical protein
MLVLTAMILRRGATAVLTFAFAALSQTPAGKDLSYLDGIPEKHRLAPAEVARLETNLIRKPWRLILTSTVAYTLLPAHRSATADEAHYLGGEESSG